MIVKKSGLVLDIVTINWNNIPVESKLVIFNKIIHFKSEDEIQSHITNLLLDYIRYYDTLIQKNIIMHSDYL